MDSLLSEPHSIELANATSRSPSDEHGGSIPHKAGVVNIWRNLLLYSDLQSKTPPSANRGHLKHYRQEEFDESTGEPPYHLGSGVTFSVSRRRMFGSSEDTEPTYVAVKTLKLFKRSQLGDEDASRAVDLAANVILRELRILTHSPLQNHENIVTLLGYYSDQTVDQHSTKWARSDIALVVEYSPNGTLDHFLKLEAYSNYSNGKGLGLSLKVNFMRDITAGLEALHGCGIAHGDMKLENMLVFPHDHRNYIVKISDFGNSLLDMGDKKQEYRGTPILTPPEVRRASDDDKLLAPSEIMACEIFSLGLMIWEILLDGHRFTVVISGELADAGDIAPVYALNSLPQDELWLQALICSHEYEREDKGLYQVVRDALCLTLPEAAGARGSVADVLAALNGRATSFRKDHVSREDLSPPEPLPSTTPLILNPDQQIRSNYSNLKSLPLVVRDDLISLLRARADETNSSDQYRADACYDLAMCMIHGVQTTSASMISGLRRLAKAAELGSSDALLIIFRLSKALSLQIPASLTNSSHPLAIVERELTQERGSASYTSRRIIEYERLYQKEALYSDYQIQHQGKLLLIGRLTGLESRLAACTIPYGPEDLVCVPSGRIMGVRQQQIKLLHLAARLNLRSLVEYLLSPRPNSPAQRLHGYTFLSYEFLSSACEGGHLDMLRWIGEQKFAIAVEKDHTLLHWLVKFPIDDARAAMRILLMAAPYTLNVADTGREVFGMWLRGTALEFAIATDNIPLVCMFLDMVKDCSHSTGLAAIGWTEETFDIAVSLNLWRMIPILAPLEKGFRTTRPDEGRRTSQGKKALLPFGLFRIGILADPTLPYIIHGRSYSKAVGRTIDAVCAEGCCSMNDTDVNGKTALSNALGSSLCDFSVEIIRRMIAKGAKLASQEVVSEVSKHLFETRSDRTSRAILRLLLKNNTFEPPLDGYILGYSIFAGNLDATRMLCGLDTDGTKMPMTFAVQDQDGTPSRSLFTAAMFARKNNVDMVRLLLSLGANPDHGAKEAAPLEEAIMELYSDHEIIDSFIEAGARLCWDGRTVLTAAARRRNFWVRGDHITTHLLRHPRVRALRDTEWPGVGTPLTVACIYGSYGAVYALVKAGADLGDDDNVEFLCDVVSGVARKPWTLLDEWQDDLGGVKGLSQWRYQIEKLLLFLRKERGLIQGRTPLHFAIETGNANRARSLLEANLGLVSRRDDLGRLPIDLLDEDIPHSDNVRSYYPVKILRRYLQSCLARLARKNADTRTIMSLDAEVDRRKRRYMKFAALDYLGWGPEEAILTGQSLRPFRRRLIMDDDFVALPDDSTTGTNRRSAEFQAFKDSMLILNEDYGSEQSIVTSQYAQQAVAESRELSEQGTKTQIRALAMALHDKRTNAEEVIQNLQQISSWCKISSGANHPLVISCDLVRSRATRVAGRLDEAISLQQQLVPSLMAMEDRNHVQCAVAAEYLCRLLISAKRFQEAESQAQTCLQWARQIPEDSTSRVGEAYILIADCYMKRGDHEAIQSNNPSKGTQWFWKATNAWKLAYETVQAAPYAARLSLTLLLEQAKCYLYLGESAQVKTLCEKILRENGQSTIEEVSPVSLVAQRLLSMVDENCLDLEQTILTQERLLDLACNPDEEDPEALADALVSLAKSYLQADRLPEARQLLERALPLRTQTHGAEYVLTREIRSLAAMVYSKSKMWAKAEILQRDLLRHEEDHFPGSRPTLFLARSIADLCFQQKKFAEAEKMSRLALTKMAELDEQDRHGEMLNLAEILFQQNLLVESEKITRYVLRSAKEDETPEEAAEILQAYVMLTKLLRVQKRFAELISCRLEILRRDPDEFGFVTRVDLMSAYQKCGRLDEARAQGAKVSELLKTFEGLDVATPFMLATTLQLLASNYLDLKDYKTSMDRAEEALAVCRPMGGDSLRVGDQEVMMLVLLVLRDALEHLNMETRLDEVSKEIYELRKKSPKR